MLGRVSGGLQLVDDDGPVRCAICGGVAAGPCARCRKPTCGDCCVLTERGARTWAICLRCDERGGRSLAPGWLIVGAWVVVPSVVLLGLVLLARWLTGR
jgi:hypothetical protein